MNNHELDQKLKVWAARQNLTPGGPGQNFTLGGRGSDEPHALPACPARPSSGSSEPRLPNLNMKRRRWLPAVYFLAGVAATLAVAMLILLPRESKENRRLSELFRNEIHLTDQRHAAISKIFHETERLFGSNLQWVAETPEHVELGLSETPSDATPLVVRVSVLRKDAKGEWSKLWRVDVVARLDGVFEMNEPSDAQHLSLSLRRTSETTTFVESRLTLANGIVLNAQSSDAPYFGAPNGIKVVSDGGVSYAIIQTVKSIVGEG